ncbi:MAG: fatty acid desaturase [Gammaproteobacteria bacterium]|nr:fatty acid desaturase [Gammaproteobacteria bacterium]
MLDTLIRNVNSLWFAIHRRGYHFWNMQYHLEHHMYPAVPFFNLPKLRRAIEHDLPPAPHGLRNTWREMLALRRRFLADPNFTYMPVFPAHSQPAADVATSSLS